MTLDEKINALQSDFQSLADRLKEICKDVWREEAPEDAIATERKSKHYQELQSSVEDFNNSAGIVVSLLTERKSYSIETAKHVSGSALPPMDLKKAVNLRTTQDKPRNPSPVTQSRLKAPTHTDSKQIAIKAIKSIESTWETEAPLSNKVAMLLAVSKLIETGAINSSEVEFNILLSDKFCDILNEIGIEASLENACQAYFDLRSTSFWRLKAISEREFELRDTTTIESLNHLNRLVIYAELDENLFQCLRWPKYAEDLQNRIIRQLSRTITWEDVTPEGVLVDATEETGQDASSGFTLREDFKDTQPSMIEIEGRTYTNLSSWIDLLKAACNYCARRNPVLFESLLDHKIVGSNWGRVFARDPNTLKNPTRLDNNMWVEGLPGANGIAEFLVRLFSEFSINDDDVRVTLQDADGSLSDNDVSGLGPIRSACVARIAEHLDSEFVRDSATIFKTKDHRLDRRQVLLVSVSMDYGTDRQFRFQFSFSKEQIDAIRKSKNGWLALSCGSPDTLLLIPYSEAAGWLSQTSARRANGLRWEVKLSGSEDGFRILNLQTDSEQTLQEYLI
jgi:hypothetical protein